MNSEEQTNPGRSKPLIWGSIRVAISVGLLAYLLNLIDVRESLQVMHDARLELLLVALFLVLAIRAFAAYRWYVLVRAMDARVPFLLLLRYVFVSNFLGFFMPGTVGVELVRVYSLSRATSNLAMAFSSVLLERLLAFLAIMLLVLTGLAMAPVGLPPIIARAAWVGLAIMGGGIFLVMHSSLRRLTYACLPGTRLAPVRDKLRKLYLNLDACKHRPLLMTWAALMALAFQLLRVVRLAVTAAAFGIQFPFLYFLIFSPMVLFISQIPVSIAGLGVREGSFVYLFGLAGMPAEEAFMLSLIALFFMILETAPGAVLYATGERKRLRAGAQD